MYSHVACDVMKERTLYLLKPSSLIWHLIPYLFLFNKTAEFEMPTWKFYDILLFADDLYKQFGQNVGHDLDFFLKKKFESIMVILKTDKQTCISQYAKRFKRFELIVQ